MQLMSLRFLFRSHHVCCQNFFVIGINCDAESFCDMSSGYDGMMLFRKSINMLLLWVFLNVPPGENDSADDENRLHRCIANTGQDLKDFKHTYCKCVRSSN